MLGFPGKRRGERLEDALPAKESNVRILKPAWMKRIRGACGVWDELVQSMTYRLEPQDVPAFSDLCVCIARLRAEEKRIEIEGRVKKGERTGRQKVRNPRIMTAFKYREAMRKWCAAFYLTPGDRAGKPEQEQPKGSTYGNTLNGRWGK